MNFTKTEFKDNCILLEFNASNFDLMEIQFYQMNNDLLEFSLQLTSGIQSRHERQAIALGLMGLTEAAEMAWNWYENRKNMVIHNLVL